MKSLLITIVLAFFFVSCKDEKDEGPFLCVCSPIECPFGPGNCASIEQSVMVEERGDCYTPVQFSGTVICQIRE